MCWVFSKYGHIILLELFYENIINRYHVLYRLHSHIYAYTLECGIDNKDKQINKDLKESEESHGRKI